MVLIICDDVMVCWIVGVVFKYNDVSYFVLWVDVYDFFVEVCVYVIIIQIFGVFYCYKVS